MSHFPKEGERTICELHCQLLTATREDDPNWDRLASVKGSRYPDVMVTSACQVAPHAALWEPNGSLSHRGHVANNAGAATTGVAGWAASRVASLADAIGLGAVCPDSWRAHADASHAGGEQVATQGPVKCLSWHPRRETLAVADDQCQVHVFSYAAAPRVERLMLANRHTSEAELSAAGVADPQELVRTFPAPVLSLAWRPCASGTLAVGTSKGTFLWTIAAAGQGAEGLAPWGSRAESYPTTGLSDARVLRLEGSGGAAASCLAWNPYGRLLAVGSVTSSNVTVWDVSTGGRETLNGAAGAALLRWSPTDDYLWCALANSSCFQIWETARWTHEKWGGGHVAIRQAAWAPSGRALFIGLGAPQQAAALYLTAPPPSLDANLLPVDLPDVCQRYPELRHEGAQLHARMSAWDALGDRLAIVLRRSCPPSGSSLAEGEGMRYPGDHAGGGGDSAGGDGADGGNDHGAGREGPEDLVALFSTRQYPMISLTLIGLIRGPKRACVTHMEFHPNRPRGALLCVAWSTGCVSVYPLYYKKSA
eukprot:jgi/Mesvir1/3276/Mv16408-RA.1